MNLPANAGDLRDAGSIPGSGRSPGGGHGSPLQYSCLETPLDGGAWWGYPLWGRNESDTTEATWHAQIKSGLDTGIQFKKLLQAPTDEAYRKLL